jgi:uncharacterized SAM-binding protein YcdF (DUF218 family)
MSFMSLDSTVTELAQRLWNYLRLDLPVEKADCIVGLGSYDLRVAERCAELYAGGWAPFIIFSGHLGNWTKRMWGRSEAEIFAEHAVERGVPREKITLETRSTNIGENVKFTRDLLLALGAPAKSLIMVSKQAVHGETDVRNLPAGVAGHDDVFHVAPAQLRRATSIWHPGRSHS